MIARAGMILLAWLITCAAFSQKRPLKKFTPREGLAHSVVYRISQDREGFLWFSTDNGLTRYDGNSFENFTSRDGLGSNFIFGTHENDTSFLAAAYGQGIASYHSVTNRFTLLPHTKPLLYPIDFVTTPLGLFVIDRDKKLYHMTASSVRHIAIDSGQISSPIGVFKLVSTSLNGLLAASSQGFARYNVEKKKFELIQLNGLFLRKTYYSVLELTDQQILLASDDGIYKVNLTHRQATMFMPGNFKHHSEALFKDRQGNIWISTLAGELWMYTADLKNKELIAEGVIINQIFQDNENNIWLATYGEGVLCLPTLHLKNYVPPSGMLITDLQFDLSLKQPLILSNNFNIRTINPRHSPGTTHFSNTMLLKKKPVIILINPQKEEYIAGSYAYFYRQYQGRIDSIKSIASISSLYKASDGSFLVGTRKGLLQIDPAFKKATPVEALQKRIVRSVSDDYKQNILAGTDEGIYIQSENDWKIISTQNGLPNSYINSIYKDSAKHCHWIGTNEGLVRMDNDYKITSFNHPFARLRCNSIVADEEGTIWIATNEGLVSYKQGGFFLYNDMDGFPSDIFKLAYDKAANSLYALSWNSLSVVELDGFGKAERPKSIPALVFKEMTFDGQSFRKTDTVQLLKPTTYATVKFAIPYFHNRKQWVVQYKINNSAWKTIDSKTEATLFDIPFGDSEIVFHVVDLNQHVLALRTLVLYNPVPLYRTLWFMIAMLALGIAAIVFLTHYILRKKSQQKELALLAIQQQMDLEHKALKNMLSPHFMNNAINSIQAFVTRNDQRSTLSYLAKFARLMRANLELLENSMVSLDKELNNLKLYLTFEVLRFSGNLSYEITLDETINTAYMKLPSLVLQPFIENAIWHGILPRQEKGHLSIDIRRNDKSLLMVLEDDGIGLIESTKRKKDIPAEKPSRGLKIVEKRFSLLNKIRPGHSIRIIDRSVADPSLSGTRVEIVVPIIY